MAAKLAAPEAAPWRDRLAGILATLAAAQLRRMALWPRACVQWLGERTPLARRAAVPIGETGRGAARAAWRRGAILVAWAARGARVHWTLVAAVVWKAVGKLVWRGEV